MKTIRIYLDDMTWYDASLVMLTRDEEGLLMLTFVANRQTHAVDIRKVKRMELA